MRFGPVPVVAAAGGVLAHSLAVGGAKLRKGRVLNAADVAAMAAAGLETVTVARLDPGDLSEDAAAETLARALAPESEAVGLAVSPPFTGRVNLFAAAAGLVRVDKAAVDRVNAVDPAITLATAADWARVEARAMVATVKIIPYGVAGSAVASAVAALNAGARVEAEFGAGALRIAAFRPGHASLILTRTAGTKESLLVKGAEVVRARLRRLGIAMAATVTVPHETAAVAEAVRAARGEMVLILGASATSDAGDVVPAGLSLAGGRLIRFGMPVDPGNLLVLGEHAGRTVVGLPGCARSPALNGADWVLERLAAGVAVTAADIGTMGVGGLLKEIPSRPQPRADVALAARGRPRVAVLVLAAGAGRRMLGRDKLLEPVADGRPILRAVADATLASQADVVVVVLPPEAAARRAALTGLGVEIVEAADCAEGMAASLRGGLRAVVGRVDAVVVALADMPEVGTGAIDRLIAAFDPGEGREICRSVSAAGEPGHPVLFGARFFETLAGLTGDRGAREVLGEAAEFVTDVPTPGRGAVVDLDTPEDWAAWRAGASA